ncbi:Glutamate--tRNA ligase mitochondrial [Saxophila tyrrhenica]|uniref:glutamate--tRNA ligase n=1 Tax=Saxophila tyrrhenica TaxID=1690608 RepID=A0AAV9P830_9PEZI|nr:Glutamate--tRNA ligase mitochondrial [Saxophila tyrrhenica]
MKTLSSLRPAQWQGTYWICSRCSLLQQRRPAPLKSAQVSSLGTGKYNTRQGPVRAFSSCAEARSKDTANRPRRRTLLPQTPARTRFAPSPTGHLHIGGLRTALFSYLLAKRTGGQLLLRIEDTDQKRLVPGAEAQIYKDLQWAGLQWDEGPEVGGPYGPYRQSERNDIYRTHADEVLERGAAYRCFCPPLKSGDQRAAYVTSGCYQNCSLLEYSISKKRAQEGQEPFTVRLHPPPPVDRRDKGKHTVPDLVYGKIQRLKRSPAAPQASASSEDGGDSGIDAADTVLVKSDGTPTYHFANVVDDHLMKITHVIRGAEWMASTPLHFDIYNAFGWEPPEFAHVGLLVDENEAKLSKRTQDGVALDVASMRDKYDVLPEPLVNFLALLGWSNPTRDDVMDMEALISNFDLKFTRGNTMVKMDKLWYLQKNHVRPMLDRANETNDFAPIMHIVSKIANEVAAIYDDPIINGQSTFKEQKTLLPDRLHAYCADILLADRNNYATPKAWVDQHTYFFEWDEAKVPEIGDKMRSSPGHHVFPTNTFKALANAILDDIPWDANDIPTLTLGPSNPSERAIAALVSRINNIVAKHTWALVLTQMQHELPLAGDQNSGDIAPPLPPHPIADSKIPAWLHRPSLDAEDFKPENLAPHFATTEEHGVIAELAETLKWWHKLLNPLVHRYLRTRLAYGMPGPSVGWVMGLLGREECLRRLGS